MLERINTPGALPAQVGHEDVAQLLQENCDQEQHTLQGVRSATRRIATSTIAQAS